MSDCCHDAGCAAAAGGATPVYRRVLWIALAVNAAMFAVEVGVGVHAGSVAMMGAALGVFGTGTAWPDLAVAAIMAALALAAAVSVLRRARGELAAPAGR